MTKGSDDKSIKYFNRGKEIYQLEIPRSSLPESDDRDLDFISPTKNVRLFYTDVKYDKIWKDILYQKIKRISKNF